MFNNPMLAQQPTGGRTDIQYKTVGRDFRFAEDPGEYNCIDCFNALATCEFCCTSTEVNQRIHESAPSYPNCKGAERCLCSPFLCPGWGTYYVLADTDAQQPRNDDSKGIWAFLTQMNCLAGAFTAVPQVFGLASLVRSKEMPAQCNSWSLADNCAKCCNVWTALLFYPCTLAGVMKNKLDRQRYQAASKVNASNPGLAPESDGMLRF